MLLIAGLTIFSLNARADFSCKTKSQTANQNSNYSITVQEATAENLNTMISLTLGDATNDSAVYSCSKGSVNGSWMGAEISTYVCRGINDNLEVGIWKDETKWTAKLQLNSRQLNDDRLDCKTLNK